jgi:adenylate cyclase
MTGLNTVNNFSQIDSLKSLEDCNRALTERVGQQLDQIKRMGRLKRFLPAQLAESILKSDENDLFKCHRREITAIFLDLRGFTAFSNRAEPEDVMALLLSYYSEAGKVIFKFDGTLEYFAGDGMMVFFNAPVPCENHPKKAVLMALEIRDRVKELRAAWVAKSQNLDLGIGLATGYAAVGNIGFADRMNYAAVGSVINLAARLCAAAKGGQILTNEKTLSKIENIVDARPLQQLRLKGFVRPVKAFNIVSLKCLKTRIDHSNDVHQNDCN